MAKLQDGTTDGLPSKFPSYNIEATLWMPLTDSGRSTGITLLASYNQPAYQIASLMKMLTEAACLPRDNGYRVTIEIEATGGEL